MSNKNIFKTFAFVGVLAGIMSITACTDYSDDINAVNRRVDDLERRVKALEDMMKTANDNITSIQEIVDNISYDGYVTNVTQLENGYELIFGDGTKVTIHDGKDGIDGVDGVDGEDAVFPAISVNRSSTRHDELLTSQDELAKMWIIRKFINAMNSSDEDESKGTEFLIQHLSMTKTNEEFFESMKK